jgi:hypothetical protein
MATAKQTNARKAAPTGARNEAHYYRGQRRAQAIKTPEFVKALRKDLEARPDYKRCAHGHDMTNPKNVHVGDLMRTGKRTCNTCWLGQQAKYMAAQ